MPRSESRNSFRAVYPFALAIGYAVAAAATYAAWDHNPQGEFHDETRVALGALLMIFVSFFFVATIAAEFVLGVAWWSIGKLRRSDAA